MQPRNRAAGHRCEGCDGVEHIVAAGGTAQPLAEEGERNARGRHRSDHATRDEHNLVLLGALEIVMDHITELRRQGRSGYKIRGLWDSIVGFKTYADQSRRYVEIPSLRRQQTRRGKRRRAARRGGFVFRLKLRVERHSFQIRPATSLTSPATNRAVMTGLPSSVSNGLGIHVLDRNEASSAPGLALQQRISARRTSVRRASARPPRRRLLDAGLGFTIFVL